MAGEHAGETCQRPAFGGRCTGNRGPCRTGLHVADARRGRVVAKLTSGRCCAHAKPDQTRQGLGSGSGNPDRSGPARDARPNRRPRSARPERFGAGAGQRLGARPTEPGQASASPHARRPATLVGAAVGLRRAGIPAPGRAADPRRSRPRGRPPAGWVCPWVDQSRSLHAAPDLDPTPTAIAGRLPRSVCRGPTPTLW